MTRPASLPVDALADALSGPVGDQIVRLIVGSCFDAWQVPPAARTPTVLETAEEAGLIVDGEPTALAETLSHPLRELVQWEERGRTLPLEGEVAEMRPRTYRGADVLEVGSGFGVNLLSLQHHARRAVGVEIDPAYVELAPVLAAAAGEPPPEVVIGQGEALPFADASFDYVLVIGALQYMEIARALAEMHRVLRPGGEVLAVLGHLSGYLVDAAQRHAHHPAARPLIREAREIATMVSYPWVGRLLGKSGSPVYPRRRRMQRYIEEAGFTLVEQRRVGLEALYRMKVT